MKVFYRALKWRLSLNDCRNRGYILDCFPNNIEEIKWIFYPVKPKKLERIRPKPKKLKKKKTK
jgi:adenylate kinase